MHIQWIVFCNKALQKLQMKLLNKYCCLHVCIFMIRPFGRYISLETYCTFNLFYKIIIYYYRHVTIFWVRPKEFYNKASLLSLWFLSLKYCMHVFNRRFNSHISFYFRKTLVRHFFTNYNTSEPLPVKALKYFDLFWFSLEGRRRVWERKGRRTGMMRWMFL